MKKIFIALFCSVALVGCTITRTTYEGTIVFPENVMFDKANFKYVKTISGSSHAVYNGYGYDKKRSSEGLINTAKENMYKNHVFMPNQIITNISRDVIRTYDEKGFNSKYEVKVVISADIYEFSSNGVYSKLSKSTSKNHKQENYKGGELSQDVAVNSIDDEQNTIKTNSKLTPSDYNGFVKINYGALPRKYKKGEKVIYFDGLFFKGTIYENSNFEKAKVSNIYQKINDKWVPINSSNANIVKTISIKTVTYYKPN